MKTIKDYFSIKELVCRDVYNKHGENAWTFFDPRLLDVLLFIRTNLNKPIQINTWASGGSYSQRGYRCNLCSLVKDKKSLYCSAHTEGMAVDFDVKGMTAEQVRNWLWNNKERIPHPIRVEKEVNWVHIDVRSDGASKIKYFAGVLLLLLLLSGCKPTEVVVHDVVDHTEYVDRLVRDTTYVHDSVLVREKADTTWIERWHTQYVERIKIDSVYVNNTDTINIYRTEYVKVKPTLWERFTSSVGLSILWIVLAFVGWIIYRICRH